MTEPYDPNQGYVGPPPVYPAHGQQSPAYPSQGQPLGYQPNGYQPNGYQPNGYQPNGYQPQGYPQPGYPGGGYPAAPAYSIYPNPGAQYAGRPGQVIATAVLNYVEAGILILTGLILFSGSSAVSNWSDDTSTSDHGWGAQFALAGFGDLVAAGLLIAGGVLFTGGKRLGRTLGAVGLALCLVEAAFWVIRLSDDSGAIFPWAAFYLVMPIIGTCLAYAGTVSRWLDATSPRPASPGTTP